MVLAEAISVSLCSRSITKKEAKVLEEAVGILCLEKADLKACLKAIRCQIERQKGKIMKKHVFLINGQYYTTMELERPTPEVRLDLHFDTIGYMRVTFEAIEVMNFIGTPTPYRIYIAEVSDEAFAKIKMPI